MSLGETIELLKRSHLWFVFFLQHFLVEESHLCDVPVLQDLQVGCELWGALWSSLIYPENKMHYYCILRS